MERSRIVSNRKILSYLMFGVYIIEGAEIDFRHPSYAIELVGVTELIGAEGGTRTPTSYLTRPSNVRVYQFRHFGKFGKAVHYLLGEASGEAVEVVGTAAGAAGVGVGVGVAAGG